MRLPSSAVISAMGRCRVRPGPSQSGVRQRSSRQPSSQATGTAHASRHISVGGGSQRSHAHGPGPPTSQAARRHHRPPPQSEHPRSGNTPRSSGGGVVCVFTSLPIVPIEPIAGGNRGDEDLLALLALTATGSHGHSARPAEAPVAANTTWPVVGRPARLPVARPLRTRGAPSGPLSSSGTPARG